jgi:hypothetical protein
MKYVLLICLLLCNALLKKLTRKNKLFILAKDDKAYDAVKQMNWSQIHGQTIGSNHLIIPEYGHGYWSSSDLHDDNKKVANNGWTKIPVVSSYSYGH